MGRKDVEGLERESITIKLGREYVVYALPIRDSKAWREKFVATVKPLLDGLGQASQVEFNSAADLIKLMPLLETLLTAGVDRIIELLFAYSPELAAARATIEAEASDKEAIQAFKEVLALADPFGLLASFSGSPNGLVNGETLKRSRGRSGERT